MVKNEYTCIKYVMVENLSLYPNLVAITDSPIHLSSSSRCWEGAWYPQKTTQTLGIVTALPFPLILTVRSLILCLQQPLAFQLPTPVFLYLSCSSIGPWCLHVQEDWEKPQVSWQNKLVLPLPRPLSAIPLFMSHGLITSSYGVNCVTRAYP